MAFTLSDILKIIAAIVLPPLGVFLEKGACDKDVLINVLLTLLGYIPGMPALRIPKLWRVSGTFFGLIHSNIGS
jgi:uncharacterized membrane protein YqaE (UPF0057 family)